MIDDKDMGRMMNEAKRSLPQTDIEFNALTTNPVWGTDTGDIPVQLRARLTELIRTVDDNGQPAATDTELWDLLSYFTRDLRLGNLQQNIYNDEVKECHYYLNLAGDLLQLSYKRAFLICLSRVAAIVEISQSRGGFFRRRMGTITGESIQQSLDPPKRNLLGAAKKNDPYGG